MFIIMKQFFLLGIAASVGASVLPRSQAPPGDNCLRAIRNKTRPGAEDCASYLRTTVTPATKTLYETLTFTQSTTETYPQTKTNEILVTATNTIPATLEITTSVTVTITTAVPLQKRQVTIAPVSIPAYASPCSGAIRYSSACSQLGVFPTVTTVVAPSTTVTSSTTLFSTESISPTVDTVAVTKTDKTVDYTLTEATTTKTIVATHTVVSQCLSSNIASAPVSYQNVGLLVIAGVGWSQGNSASSPEECCTACFNDGNCFGFSYGNYDPAYFNPNDFNQPPPVTPNSRCYIMRIVTGGCNFNSVAFGPIGGSAPAGGVAKFGYGRCRVSPW